MRLFAAIIGCALLLTILWDAFETIVLPRRVTRKFRLARAFYRSTWVPWRAIAGILPEKRREYYLSLYGPLSLLLLVATWALGLIFGFAFLIWSADSGAAHRSFGTDLYFSGTTFFTIGFGDVAPLTSLTRALAVIEGGTGFGFLALMISYLPILYQSFSRREVNISLLDARAGSPPTAAELLRRHAYDQRMEALHELLRDWERWSAELMESHISYPVLSYFRSQHNNQSWLAALTVILDTSALLIVGIDHVSERQAQLTFAIARHAVVDLAQIFSAAPLTSVPDRLPPQEMKRLREMLRDSGVAMQGAVEADQRLAATRAMYEPFVSSLAQYLSVKLPPWIKTGSSHDNWQTTAWGTAGALPGTPTTQELPQEHF